MDNKRHGNSLENEEEHHLYQIIDQENNDIYKYGICGKALNLDGSSPRANKQAALLNRAIGLCRFVAKVLLAKIKGRTEALKIESQYIEEYEKQYSRKPVGNLK